MMRKFGRINKSTPALRLSFKRHPFASLKILDRNALLGKCTAAIFSVIVDCEDSKQRNFLYRI